MTDRTPRSLLADRAAARADRLVTEANAHAVEGRWDEAEALYRQALGHVPDHVEALNNLGNALTARGRAAEALAHYQRLLALGVDHPVVHYNLGSALRAVERVEAALAHLRRAIELDPAHADAHNNLGNALRDLRMAGPAAESYLRALTLQPGADWVHENLSNALVLLGQTGEAERAARLAARWVDAFPDQPRARHVGAAVAGRNREARAPDDYVRDAFDAFAGSFDGTLAALGYQAPELLAEAVAGEGVAPGADLDVLDAGCGTGLCAHHLRPAARRLVGVDLSSGMLARARERGLYDALEEAELGAFLAAREGAFDLIVAADVLCYFGVLDDVLAAAARALRPGGLLAFTVERLEGEPHRVGASGRYAHGEGYVRAALAGAGFPEFRLVTRTLRQESGRPVHGFVVTARRPGRAP